MADLLYIPDMAKLLGTTEAAIRSRIQRNADIPPHAKLGSRIIWTQPMYDKWLQAKTSTIKAPHVN